jgi:hypothetical protein
MKSYEILEKCTWKLARGQTEEKASSFRDSVCMRSDNGEETSAWTLSTCEDSERRVNVLVIMEERQRCKMESSYTTYPIKNPTEEASAAAIGSDSWRSRLTESFHLSGEAPRGEKEKEETMGSNSGDLKHFLRVPQMSNCEQL